MKKVFVPVVISVALVITAIFSCRLVADNNNTSQGVYALRLGSGDVSPWTEDQDGYSTFKAATLVNVINGGADQYVNEGLLEGFAQYISNSSKKATIKIMDFGTAANATSMYQKMDALNSSKIAAGDYELNTAQLDNSPSSGVNAYAHFGQYYIEISFTEFSDKSDARSTAANFLEVFEAKIQML